MKVAETHRLNLRLFALQDVEHVHGLIYADPEVAVPWIGHTLSAQEVRAPRAFLSRIARAGDEPGLLAVDRIADRIMIGLAGVVPLRRAEDQERFDPPEPLDRVGAVPDRREMELVVALGRAFWNRGYATEAATAVINIGFSSLGLSRVVASVSFGNTRGLALLRRLGFRMVPNGTVDPQTGAGARGTIGFLDAPVGR